MPWLERRSCIATYRVTDDSGNGSDDRYLEKWPFPYDTLLAKHSGTCIELDEERSEGTLYIEERRMAMSIPTLSYNTYTNPCYSQQRPRDLHIRSAYLKTTKG